MSKKVDETALKAVAANARINLTDEEVKKFLPQLEEILTTFKKLDEVNTDKVKPSFQPIEIKNILREDEVKESLTLEEALQNTTLKKDNYFKGPKTV